MILTLLLILFFTLSGTVLTYLYSDEDSLLVRLCSGHITGAALFGLIAFLLGCAMGLTPATIFLSLAISLLPLALLAKKDLREKLFSNFAKSPEINLKNSLSAAYYIAFFVLLYFFFDRAMIETPQGIFTGGSQNLGDLPFHLGAIFSFTEGQNLPPENPSFAFAKFTYPFMADFLSACFVAVGARVREAMMWQSILLGFSLVVLFENFARSLTKNRLAGKLSPVIFLFCGGLGFLIFFRDYANDGRPVFEFLWNLPADYTIREKGIRFGNSLVALFMTQRGFLLGMPIMLIVLTYLWKIFSGESKGKIHRDGQDEQDGQDKKNSPLLPLSLSPLLPGLLAGTLVLTHAHSLAVLFVVCAFLFFFSLEKWRTWLTFGLAVSVVAVPQLIWIMTGSATRLTQFVDWHFGWDARNENIFTFWAKNLGLFSPLLVLALWQIFSKRGEKGTSEPPAPAGGFQEVEKESGAEGEKGRKGEREIAESQSEGRRTKDEGQKSQIPNTKYQIPITNYQLLIFYIPFLLIFILSNLVKFAPWEWDNIKVLIYWYVASVPLVAWLLARMWAKDALYKFAFVVCLVILIFSGALDVWRVVSRQINYQVFSRDAVKIAEQIKQKTAPNALFLNAPTYNSAVVLAGRRSLMRYSGHLSSYGIDYVPRELEVKRIYEGTALAETFLKRHGIEYVLISPEEKSNLKVNEAFFSRYPVIAQVGEYRVHQVKN